MSEAGDFVKAIAEGYATDGPAIDLGRGMHDGEVFTEAVVQMPIRMANRHGLVAGATGTGKTRTLQGIAEQLSANGVPVFVADIKGDLTGLAVPAPADGPGVSRNAELGIDAAPTGFPVEFLSVGGIGPGVPLRTTVSDFGPLLLAKVLGANQTQEASLGLVFHYADQHELPLVDLTDLRALLTYLGSGEAVASILDRKGVPTPVVASKLPGPLSSMEPAGDPGAAAKASPLFAKYGTRVENISAAEILKERLKKEEEAGSSDGQAPAGKTETKSKPEAKAGDDGGLVSDGAEAIGKFLKSRDGFSATCSAS